MQSLIILPEQQVMFLSPKKVPHCKRAIGIAFHDVLYVLFWRLQQF